MATFEAIPFPKVEWVTFRELKPEETERLTPFLQQQGWGIPLPFLAGAVVGEYEGRIVSFGVAQLIPHAEPLWVDPEWRATGLALRTARELANYMILAGSTTVVSIATSEFSEKLCMAMGMKEVKGKLFIRE